MKPDPRPFPALNSAEIDRELEKLTDDQIDALWEVVPGYFSMRTQGAALYQEAIRRGWLLGPA